MTKQPSICLGFLLISIGLLWIGEHYFGQIPLSKYQLDIYKKEVFEAKMTQLNIAFKLFKEEIANRNFKNAYEIVLKNQNFYAKTISPTQELKFRNEMIELKKHAIIEY